MNSVLSETCARLSRLKKQAIIKILSVFIALNRLIVQHSKYRPKGINKILGVTEMEFKKRNELQIYDTVFPNAYLLLLVLQRA